MLILSLSILHPLSLVQQGAEEVGTGTELPCSKDVWLRGKNLDLESRHALWSWADRFIWLNLTSCQVCILGTYDVAKIETHNEIYHQGPMMECC